jgi:hypothetical protein
MIKRKSLAMRCSPTTMATVALASGGKTALAALLFNTPYQVNPPANGIDTESVSGAESFGAWTATFDNSSTGRSRTVDTSAAPGSLILGLSQSTTFFVVPDSFEFAATVPGDAPAGLVSFDYNYAETDPDGSSSFAYTRNGTSQTITSAPGSSTLSFSVNPGDTFGFVLSSSYYFASSSVTITNFNAPAVPEPSALALLATGFGGVIGLRLRRRATG